MNSLFNHQEDDGVEETSGRRDREITLGTTMVLGIFFALAVLCAVFFGFGYSLGSRRIPPTTAASTEATPAPSTFNTFKPAPGSPLASKQPDTTRPPSQAARTPPPSLNADPTEADQARPQPVKVPIKATPALPPALPPAAPPAPLSATQSVVQIAAVSHQEDADLLVSTLKRRGYSVSVRPQAQDKLLHVQIGPFANRKDADLMRQRLLADGFNAIVK